MPGRIISHIFSTYLPEKPPTLRQRVAISIRSSKPWQTLKKVVSHFVVAHDDKAYLKSLETLPASVESCVLLELAVTLWGRGGKGFISTSEREFHRLPSILILPGSQEGWLDLFWRNEFC